MIVDNIDMASRLPGQLSESKETSGIASIVAFCRQAYVHLQVPVIIYKVHVANILALFILGEGATRKALFEHRLDSSGLKSNTRVQRLKQVAIHPLLHRSYGSFPTLLPSIVETVAVTPPFKFAFTCA